jgi:hypothetical protein
MPFTATVPYADSTYAASYMAERLGTAAWDSASAGDRTKSLIHATRMIDTLAFAGEKNDVAQAREFPRCGDADVPVAVQNACCELALALLAGKLLENTEERGNLRSESIGDVAVSYDEDGGAGLSADHAGIPSAEAFRLLAPWLIDERRVHLDRAG